MKKGDQAFFYHSNCKVPGIVGIMEIVQEHSPDGVSIRVQKKQPRLTDYRIRIKSLRPLLRRKSLPGKPQVGSCPRRLPPQIPQHHLAQRPESPGRCRPPPERPANPQTIPAQCVCCDTRAMEVHSATGQGEGRGGGVQR